MLFRVLVHLLSRLPQHPKRSLACNFISYYCEGSWGRSNLLTILSELITVGVYKLKNGKLVISYRFALHDGSLKALLFEGNMNDALDLPFTESASCNHWKINIEKVSCCHSGCVFNSRRLIFIVLACIYTAEETGQLSPLLSPLDVVLRKLSDSVNFIGINDFIKFSVPRIRKHSYIGK